MRADVRDPGLYFKLPFVDNVVYFDKRVLDLDLPVQTVLSADRQNLEVDAFARYRIIDPLRFYQAVEQRHAGQPAPGELRQLVACATCSPAPRGTRSCAPSAPSS